MTPAERLIAQIKAQRLSWVELEPAADGRAAKRVQITRPPETAMPDFVAKTDDGQYTLKAEIRHVNAYTVGWEGFIESDLVGPAGASDPVGLHARAVADGGGRQDGLAANGCEGPSSNPSSSTATR
jgi:hypothetical protein